MHELIVDSFAGGGGASEGIRLALGRDPDIAINHDALALAMHRANHPGTRHLVEDVWHVDPIGTAGGQPVGLFWMSPDCKHFSKAKGGKPREKDIRGLAWVGLRWVRSLPKWQRPRVVILENVEEFQDWGPLLDDGRPCPVHKGATFKQFVAAFEGAGYVVEWRELRACDYGAPTIRKRLFLIARRDGEPIAWPEPTHGDPQSEAVRAGRSLPWRTAAEIIDWSLPCPSIFDTSEEIKRLYGVRAIRPLADATMARIAKGTVRYVLQAARPFIVRTNHGDSRGRRDRGLDEPMPTSTHFGGDALVTPFVATMRNADKPFNGADEPAHTVTAGGAGLSVVSPFLVPRYGERPGQDPRTRAVNEPAPVIVPTGNEGSLAAVHLSRQFGASVGSAAGEPVGTITAGGAGKAALVAAFLAQHNSERGGKPKAGADVREPASTITASGGQQTVVAAYMAQHNTDMVGHPAEAPLSTIVGKGCTQGVVAAHMINLRGSDRRDAPADAPARTESAGGNHAATFYAFLAKYYGTGAIGQAADEPMHTVTALPRHGVVTVQVDGEPYVITDIGMRMLTPRERFSAQSFGPDYIIDRGIREDGSVVMLTAEQQGRMCGNSVCPVMAQALVAANYRPREVAPRRAAADLPLLTAAG
ncbi:DNA cytosine methyltransferase [Chelatococcus reniformis]|uniref:DNA (cytosine-5-)-methyltransferase n=1 Tax=Chelatococcus reniformis TaxID=1494448 RepID=A0A916UFT1_9HYPH|nr:DNA cytosine methyltransferase [Chelatococcus reniformis]GGC70419.1 DNA methyltransferase [Chelatococcus reniformis]